MFNQPKSTRNPLVFDRFFLRPNREVLIFGQPRPGDEVIIKGLAKAPELNGKKAPVPAATGRMMGHIIAKLEKWMGKWMKKWMELWMEIWMEIWKSYEIMIPSSFFITQQSPISVSLCHSFVFLQFL